MSELTQVTVDRVAGALSAYLYEYESVEEGRAIWATFQALAAAAGFDVPDYQEVGDG